MKQSLPLSLLFLALGMPLCGLAAESAAPAEGWIPLFDGKSLTGWKATGDAIFKVEDGVLIGTQTNGQGGDLWHEAERADFELRIEYRVRWPANSGFWFRCSQQGQGYQFDVLKYANPEAYSGTLYCPGKMFITRNLDESLEHKEDWNEARILAKGSDLTLWLNGKEVGRCRDDTFQKGHIGIQVHGGDEMMGMQIQVRKAHVRDL